jgi:hypothetical protein
MKKKCFLIVIVIVIVLAMSAWATPFNRVAHADEILIIHGSNDPDCSDGSCDSKTIQDALDNANPGAMLILEGTFDFGNDQFVSLKKDVTIKGERGHSGEYLAVIKGGMNTFALGWDPTFGFSEFDEYCGLISNLNTQRWPAEFTIKDLQFEEPTWSAIMGAAATGASIKNNRFIGGLQINAGCNAYGFEPPDGSMRAISFTTWPDARSPVMGSYQDINGHIQIENNYFDGQVRLDPDGFDPAHGGSSFVHGEPIRVNGMLTPVEITGTEAQITIKNNEFENINWGIFFADNSGSQIIVNNKLMMNPEDDDGNPIGFVFAGISVQNYGDRVNMAPVLIKNNFIYSRVPDFVYGILSASKYATIKNNHLVLDQPQETLWNAYGDSAGIIIADEADYNFVMDNTISGSGQTAIVVEGYNDDVWTVEFNLIKNNDISGFTPLDATDFWCRVFEGVDCPTVPGSHYHLTVFTSNNTVIDSNWSEGMVLLDDTSDYNPYDPATYNGDNNILLGSK